MSSCKTRCNDIRRATIAGPTSILEPCQPAHRDVAGAQQVLSTLCHHPVRELAGLAKEHREAWRNSINEPNKK